MMVKLQTIALREPFSPESAPWEAPIWLRLAAQYMKKSACIDNQMKPIQLFQNYTPGIENLASQPPMSACRDVLTLFPAPLPAPIATSFTCAHFQSPGMLPFLPGLRLSSTRTGLEREQLNQRLESRSALE